MQFRFGKGSMTITVPAFDSRYLNHALKSRSIEPLAALFSKAGDAAKEYTESCSALSKLEKWADIPRNVLHVGDGAHARTATLFAYHTRHNNYSVDPAIVKCTVWYEWASVYNPQRVTLCPQTIEDFLQEPPQWLFDGPPLLLTFVHAHVSTEAVLASLPSGSWAAAYVSACCEPKTQLIKVGSDIARVVKSGQDWGILSPKREFQVVVPR